MLTAFVAIIDDEDTDRCPRGNGKTNCLVYYGYRYYKSGYTIWSNFYTTFSEMMGFQEMINKLKEYKRQNDILESEGKPIIKRKIVLLVTEMQELINSVGSTQDQILFVESFTGQMRKLNVDCLYDTQILKHLHKRLRRHTENIRIPIKKHLNGKECNFDRCEKKHIIEIQSFKPFKKYPIKRIKAYEVGKLYNTNDIVIDKLVIPKEEKRITKKELPEKELLEKELSKKELPKDEDEEINLLKWGKTHGV